MESIQYLCLSQSGSCLSVTGRPSLHPQAQPNSIRVTKDSSATITPACAIRQISFSPKGVFAPAKASPSLLFCSKHPIATYLQWDTLILLYLSSRLTASPSMRCKVTASSIQNPAQSIPNSILTLPIRNNTALFTTL